LLEVQEATPLVGSRAKPLRFIGQRSANLQVAER